MDQKVNKAYAFMKATIEEKRLLVMEKIMHEFMPENMSMELKAKETHNTLLFVTMLTKVFSFFSFFSFEFILKIRKIDWFFFFR